MFLNHARLRNLGMAIAFAGAVSLVACAQAAPRHPATPTVFVQPVPTATATPVATATPEPTPTPEPTATVAPTPTATVTPSWSPTSIPTTNVKTYTLSLEIEGLTDESIVYGTSITVRGLTSPDAIVSINGVIVPIDEFGQFNVPLILTLGPNVVEVVASDLGGNQVSSVIAIVSLPASEAPV
ncbi:MAG: hypothetical protein O2788_06095 [Chloroflexi bacterium]|nr:hypothetical protein [Chloroflexota bacterium]